MLYEVITEILERIVSGRGEDGDIEKLEALGENIKNAALCGLGKTAPNPVLSTIKYFRDEYEAHIYNKKCPAGHCKALLNYIIDRITSYNVCYTKLLRIALPAPALYGQFKNLSSIGRVVMGLKLMGFDDVYEVARGADIVSCAIQEKIQDKKNQPVISSACPAIVRLIQVRVITSYSIHYTKLYDIDRIISYAARFVKRKRGQTGQYISFIYAFLATRFLRW